MSLWISLHLPHHSLDAVFPYWHIKQVAAAVIDQEQILDLTAAACQAGILPGMRVGTAQALAPQVTLRRRNPQAEAETLQQVLLCLLQYTPNVTQLGPHTLAMEVSASLTLFGGPKALWRKAHQALQGLGLNVRWAMAPTAQGAWSLALQTQTRQRRALLLKTLTQRLDPLPIASLPALAPWAQWLEGLGCHTLGRLRQLPRQGLQHRTHPQIMHALDAAYGKHAPSYEWVVLPQVFVRRYDTLQRLEHTQAILQVAEQLIHQLCGWLQAGKRSTNCLEFTLHHEKGRHARAPTKLPLSLSEAGWQADDFLPVLAERLTRLTLSEHVIAIELRVEQTQVITSRSSGLFPDPAQWAHQENRLLDLLRSRLGEGQVLQARPFASYLPEHANRWQPLEQNAALPGETQMPPALAEQARPFWLLDPPLALHTIRNSPVYQGRRLRLLQGPERIESGWWHEPHQQRDYFIAQDADYARYWIYRQRAELDARWFLHGLFG